MTFPYYYIKWHYSQAILDIVGIIKNFLWFFYDFFSISLLLKTFFKPFRRLGEDYNKGLDLQAIAESFIINTLMRFVGMLLRTLLIIMGVICIIFTLLFGLFFIISWLLAPLLVLFLILFGLKLISLG